MFTNLVLTLQTSLFCSSENPHFLKMFVLVAPGLTALQRTLCEASSKAVVLVN